MEHPGAQKIVHVASQCIGHDLYGSQEDRVVYIVYPGGRDDVLLLLFEQKVFRRLVNERHHAVEDCQKGAAECYCLGQILVRVLV